LSHRERLLQCVFVVFGQEAPVKIVRNGDIEQPLRVANNGFGEERSRKNSERITQRDQIARTGLGRPRASMMRRLR